MLSSFRKSFVYPHKEATSWFPSHMNKGLKQMEARLKQIDCLLEIHDARIPFSGRNPLLTKNVLSAKPHILILNKLDLIPDTSQSLIEVSLKAKHGIKNVVFTNCKLDTCPGLKLVLNQAIDLVRKNDRYNRKEAKDYNLMVIGVPNVGKSSFINTVRAVYMRKPHSLQVGNVAGVTKSVHEKLRVCENPDVFLFDTPGIMNPNIESMETAMRLAACGTLKDHLVGEESIADYILYWMNKHKEFAYVSKLGLSFPTDNIKEVLIDIAVRKTFRLKVRHFDGSIKEIPDYKLAAQSFINMFRNAEFGRMLLDRDFLTG